MITFKQFIFESDQSKKTISSTNKYDDGTHTVVLDDGYKLWWVDGMLHRLDGPAMIGPDGIMIWCQYGKKHRLDGPAVEYPNGDKQWWINDKYYTYEQYLLKKQQLVKDAISKNNQSGWEL